MAVTPFIEEKKISARLREFAERLELARKETGLTQKETGLTQKDLTEQCGTSQKVQSGYERGVVAPKIDYLFKLEQLEIDTRLLLFGDYEQRLYELSSLEQTLLDLFRQMSSQMQLQALGLLIAQIAEEKAANGDSNSNSALIAGKQSIKTIQKKIINTGVIYVETLNIAEK